MVPLGTGSAKLYALAQLQLVGSSSCLLSCRQPEHSKLLCSLTQIFSSLASLNLSFFIVVEAHLLQDVFRNYAATLTLTQVHSIISMGKKKCSTYFFWRIEYLAYGFEVILMLVFQLHMFEWSASYLELLKLGRLLMWLHFWFYINCVQYIV